MVRGALIWWVDMDDVLSDIEETVPVRTDKECLEKTGSLCVGQVGVETWGPEIKQY